MQRRAAVTEALQTWREAERVLNRLSPSSPHRPAIAAVISVCRATYLDLSQVDIASESTTVAALASLGEARRVLERFRAVEDDADKWGISDPH